MDGLTQYILNVVSNIDINALSHFDVKLILNKGCCPDVYLQKIQSKGINIEFVSIPPIGPLRDFKFGLYILMSKNKNDIFYITSNQWPICLRGGIYTVHDLIYEQYPEQLGKFSWLKTKYLRFVTKKGLNYANKVIAVSNYTKHEILKYYPKIKDLAEKVNVIYEGYEHLIEININRSKQLPFVQYLLYVGSSRGHKNLTGLLKAISLIKSSLPFEWGIVFVGDILWMNKEQTDLIQKINLKRKIIHTTGWLSEADLAGLFCKAAAFVFPSLSEGFGIPILESFYYKIPLICSNQTALPEVAGEAALYFNPNNPEDIGNKILFFIENQERLTKELIDKGTERLKLFGWKKATEELLKHINHST